MREGVPAVNWVHRRLRFYRLGLPLAPRYDEPDCRSIWRPFSTSHVERSSWGRLPALSHMVRVRVSGAERSPGLMLCQCTERAAVREEIRA